MNNFKELKEIFYEIEVQVSTQVHKTVNQEVLGGSLTYISVIWNSVDRELKLIDNPYMLKIYGNN